MWVVKRIFVSSIIGTVIFIEFTCRLACYKELLESQFSSIGISGNYGLFMRESFDQYRLFCSGRKNCRGMLFDLKVSSIRGSQHVVEEETRPFFFAFGFHYSC